MLLQHGPVIILLLTGMVASIWLQKLTPAGAVAGGVLGLLVYAGTGYTGIVLMTLFFVLGTAATAWRKGEKIRSGLSSSHESRRNAMQVTANAGVAGLASVAALLFPQYNTLWFIMMAAVFSAATADTLSSELGNVYGSRYFNVLTFKRDTKGLDGVVSWEGTLAGLAGSILIAAVFCLMQGWHWVTFFIIILAGTAGNVSDSLLGAALERKGLLQNNGVNFLNTLIAALTAALLWAIF